MEAINTDYLDPALEIDGLKIYSSGELSEGLRNDLEAFLFPSGDYPSDIVRYKEIKLNRAYLPQSTVFVYFLKGIVIATWRTISRQNKKLPIEASHIKKIIAPAFKNSFRRGDLFSFNSLPSIIPTGEIGSLKIAQSINSRLYYSILSLVLKSCEEDCFLKGFNSVFLTCKNTPQLKRLYGKKFGFNEIAEIYYDDKQIWTAMIRKLNPKKLEHYTPIKDNLWKTKRWQD